MGPDPTEPLTHYMDNGFYSKSDGSHGGLLSRGVKRLDLRLKMSLWLLPGGCIRGDLGQKGGDSLEGH